MQDNIFTVSFYNGSGETGPLLGNGYISGY